MIACENSGHNVSKKLSKISVVIGVVKINGKAETLENKGSLSRYNKI